MKEIIKNIENVTLTRDRLIEDVFDKIRDSKLSFFSKTTKESLSLYTKTSGLDESKDLWKQLLIDAICILKINDSRERIYEDSEELIKNSSDDFAKKFNLIRNSNTYGIDEIDKYFVDFIEFERVLYGTDEHYRDHVEHVLQVWAIGIGLISHNQFTINNSYIIEDKKDFNFEIESTENVELEFDKIKKEIPRREITITRSELCSMWTIISLCHDLGYPIEKTSKINKQAKKIISHFGNMNFSELNYSFDIFNTFLVEKYLNIVSSKVIIDKKKTEIQTKIKDKISKSIEDYKHGAFSGLLLFKNLTFFLETDYSINESELSNEDLRQFKIRNEILRAITGHTCSKIYHLSLNSLSFLLILCDELQEWNRPKFNDFRSKSIDKAPIVKIKKIDLKDNQNIEIEFKYEHDIDNEDIKYLYESKFKDIHNLLRGAKGDIERKDKKIKFIWNLVFEKVGITYTLIFDSNKSSFEQFRVEEKKKDETTSIDIYVKNKLN